MFEEGDVVTGLAVTIVRQLVAPSLFQMSYYRYFFLCRAISLSQFSVVRKSDIQKCYRKVFYRTLSSGFETIY